MRKRALVSFKLNTELVFSVIFCFRGNLETEKGLDDAWNAIPN